MDILRYGALVDVAWKNGGGITRNIAAATCDGQMVWRISRADVAQDGAFSSFAGLVRILTVVSDCGMVLDHPVGELHADPWQPVHFGGELDIFARLKDGPLTDLNLMFDPTLCEGSVTPLRGPLEHAIVPPRAGLTALHVLAGQPLLGGGQIDIGDTAFLDAPATLVLGAADAVLNIELSYPDQSRAIRFSIAER